MLQYNGQTLAYIGDAVFELYVREALLNGGNIQPNDLHHEAINHTNANAQYRALKSIESDLSDQEWAVVRRGRNASASKKPKKTKLQTYKMATGFEALVGYLYLSGEQERLQTLLRRAVHPTVQEQ